MTEIDTQHGTYDIDSRDWDFGVPDHAELIAEEEDLSSEWAAITARMDAIDEDSPTGGYSYLPTLQNSNSVVDDALLHASLPLPEEDGREDYWAPASDFPLSVTPDMMSPLFGSVITPLLQGADGLYTNSPTTSMSPLVLDLDGDGIESTKLGYGEGQSLVYFDLNGDGFAERTAWVTGGDGLLAWDRNSNGTIDDNGELFGNTATYADGFANLATLDTNSDDKITSADTNWTNLRVWIDADADGVTDAGELQTLSSLSITEIDLDATPLTDTYDNENLISAESSFVIGGQTRTIGDVWFRVHAMDAHNLTPVEINEATSYLPVLKGFGSLMDLPLAMSQDEDLLDMVATFATSWSTERFGDPDTLANDVRDILFRWAGVDGLDPESRGPYADAQELTFLERFYGSPYVELGGSNPTSSLRQEALANAFDFLAGQLKSSLLVQIVSPFLFDTVPIYNSVSGYITPGHLSADAIADFGVEASNADDPEVYWSELAVFLAAIEPPQGYSAGEITALDAAVDVGLPSLSWGFFANGAAYQGSFNSIHSTDFSDYIVTLWTGMTIDGGGGDDLIVGGRTQDSISGGDGNDTLNGRSGSDVLYGGNGDDTYVFEHGYGLDDFISDVEGTDTIKFVDGIVASDVRFVRQGDSLALYMDSANVAILYQQFYDLDHATNNYGEIERIVFSDDQVINLSGPLTFTGTGYNDTVNGTSVADTLIGLGGNDVLFGRGGDDTYLFNDTFGDDYVSDSGGTDTVVVGSGVNTENLSVAAYGLYNTLISSGSNSIELEYQHGMGSNYKIEFLQFDDGFKVDLVAYASWVWGTSSGQTTNGTSGIDTIFGREGDDTINGLAGADAIHGGSGGDTINGGDGNDQLFGGDGTDTLSGDANDDFLNGGLGNDNYYFASGTDTIVDTGGTDKIYLPTSIDISEVFLLRFSDAQNDLRIRVGHSDSANGAWLGDIIVTNQFAGATYSSEEGRLLREKSW